MNPTLKKEYVRGAFKVLKHQEEHASSMAPCRLDYVFIGSSLEQGNRFVGHSFMSLHPQTLSSKCLEAVEFTAFSDDVFDTPVQTLGNCVGPAHMPSIQSLFDVSIDGVGRFGDLSVCLCSYSRKSASTETFPEFFIFTILSGGSGCHKGC